MNNQEIFLKKAIESSTNEDGTINNKKLFANLTYNTFMDKIGQLALDLNGAEPSLEQLIKLAKFSAEEIYQLNPDLISKNAFDEYIRITTQEEVIKSQYGLYHDMVKLLLKK